MIIDKKDRHVLNHNQFAGKVDRQKNNAEKFFFANRRSINSILFAPGLLISLFLFAFLCIGCSSTSWSHIGDAAIQATKDPVTWGCVGGAVIFAADGNRLDRKTSGWARQHTPIFGSKATAQEASDKLRSAANIGAHLTGLFVPTEKIGDAWLWDKTKMQLMEMASAALTINTTSVLKASISRHRPFAFHGDPGHKDSFPSAHTSTTFYYATLGSIHVQQFDIPLLSRNLLSAVFYVIGAGTAWARVESGFHYPSDVLFGAALGNFFAVFISDGFVRHRGSVREGMPELKFTASNGDIMLGISQRF